MKHLYRSIALSCLLITISLFLGSSYASVERAQYHTGLLEHVTEHATLSNLNIRADVLRGTLVSE